ncbi:hypothetical protein [Paenibacillus xylaniclasticus]|uniref:hypothetical protein n=1 Tax=Paenibacillus xylaniclasticus TaxID=588083 RepID=UPI000FD6C319|nr:MULTISPECIES: hypothetical protein [Paenibacillus]
MNIYPSSRAVSAPAIMRVQHSRPYADYRLLDEHDPLVHSGADERRRRAAAVCAARSVTAFMQRIAELKSALEQGSIALRRFKRLESEDKHYIYSLIDKLNSCISTFDEYADLRRSWRHKLIEPLLSSNAEQCGIEFNEHSFKYTASNSFPPQSRSNNSRLEKRNAMQTIFGQYGAAAALQLVVEQIEHSPASALLEPEVLTRLFSSSGAVYSPFMRMHRLGHVSMLLNLKS